MEGMSGKLFFFPSCYAGLQPLSSKSPSVYSLPWARGWGRWTKRAKKFSLYLRSQVSRGHVCICHTGARSAPILNRLKRLSTCGSGLPPWVSHFSSRIQFPQWQNDSFCENVCSILPAYENPLKYTKNPYCLDPQDELGSQGLLPSNHSWRKPRRSQKGEISQIGARLPNPKDEVTQPLTPFSNLKSEHFSSSSKEHKAKIPLEPPYSPQPHLIIFST